MPHLPELKLYLEVKCNEKLPKCGRLYKLVLKKILYSKHALLFPQKKTVHSFSWTAINVRFRRYQISRST